MAKKIVSVTIESDILEKVKASLDGRTLSFVINKLLDEHISFSKTKIEDRKDEIKKAQEEEDKRRREDKEFDRVRRSKMTKEEIEQEEKDMERIEKNHEASKRLGRALTDEEWKTGIIDESIVGTEGKIPQDF